MVKSLDLVSSSISCSCSPNNPPKRSKLSLKLLNFFSDHAPRRLLITMRVPLAFTEPENVLLPKVISLETKTLGAASSSSKPKSSRKISFFFSSSVRKSSSYLLKSKTSLYSTFFPSGRVTISMVLPNLSIAKRPIPFSP